MSNPPLTIRFATDTDGAKNSLRDLAASVVSNMVSVSGALGKATDAFDSTGAKTSAVVAQISKHAEAFKGLADSTGSYATAAKVVAQTVAEDATFMGSAVAKAANQHNYSLLAMGAASLSAAKQTQTGTALMSAAWEINTAPIRAKAALVKNEAAAVWNVLSASPVFIGGVAAIAGFAAISLAIHATSKAAEEAQKRLEDLLKIASDAQGAGVGTTFLQGWVNQAKDLNLEVSKVAAMLVKARDASTVHIGEGDEEASSAIGNRLKQNVLGGNLFQSDMDRFTGASSQEQRIRVILDLIEQLRAKGSQLAAFDLAEKMFGSDFEAKLRDGVDVIGKMRTALDGMRTSGGQEIIAPGEIAAAQRINEELERARTIMADALLPLHQDIHAWEQQQAEAAAALNVQWAQVVATVMKLYDAVRAVGSAMTAMGNWSGWTTIGHVLGADSGINFAPGAAPIVDMTDADRAKATGTPTTLPAITVPGDTSNTLPSLTAKGGGSGSSDSKDAIERYIAQLTKANDTAKAELDTIGKSNVEKEKAVDLAKLDAAAKEAGRAATDDERNAVLRLAEAHATYTDRVKDAQQAQAALAQGIRHFGDEAADVFSAAIQGGDKLASTLKSLASSEIKNLLSAILTGSGPLAGILGLSAPASAGSNAMGGIAGLFGSALKGDGAASWMPSFRANGGPVSAGQGYTIGEAGKELFVPDRNGRVYPIGQADGGMGGGGGFVHAPTYHIDARGAQLGVGDQIRTALQGYDRDLSRSWGARQANWAKRNS